MSRRDPAEVRAEHAAERTRVRELERHEQDIRKRERARVVGFLCTPYPVEDDEGFEGCFHDAVTSPAPILAELPDAA